MQNLILVTLILFISKPILASEKHPQANAVFRALMDQADSVVVYKGSEKYLNLTQALALEIAEVEGKQDIRVYNNCSENGSSDQLECNLAIYYREITAKSSRVRNAVFTYTATVKLDQVEITSDVNMAVYN